LKNVGPHAFGQGGKCTEKKRNAPQPNYAYPRKKTPNKENCWEKNLGHVNDLPGFWLKKRRSINIRKMSGQGQKDGPREGLFPSDHKKASLGKRKRL